MELNNLFELIEKTCVEEGLILDTSFRNSSTDCWFISKPSDIWSEKDPNYNIRNLYGTNLEVSVVHHRNGDAHTDISYRLDIMQWARSSGHTIEHIKISSKQTEKTLKRKVIDFINLYKSKLS